MLLQTIFLLLVTSYTHSQTTTNASTSPGAEDISCTLENGSIGECLPYFLCNDTTSSSGFNGTSTHRNQGCAKILDTCCPTDGGRRQPVTTTTVKPVTTTVSNEEEEQPVEYCTLDDGTAGECVNFYLCNSNKTINDAGLDIIDIRAGNDECTSYLQTCCVDGDKRAPDNPVTPKPEPTEQPKGCGLRNPMGVGFIITGANDGETNYAEFPWMVGILRLEQADLKDPGSRQVKVYRGGGSLISTSVVLTAAHLIVDNYTFVVRAGEWDTKTDKELYPHQDRYVASIERHKNFHKGTLFFDIALLFLAKPVDLAPNVGVVCLPPPNDITPADTRCFATGWGKDKFGKEGLYQTILKKIEVPVVERNTCQAALRKTRLGRHFKLHASFMCAGGEKGKDTCKGDGGSPLSCPTELSKGRYVQSGIVAWGIGCGEEGFPGVYVHVAYLRDWVDEKVIARGYSTSSYTF